MCAAVSWKLQGGEGERKARVRWRIAADLLSAVGRCAGRGRVCRLPCHDHLEILA